MLHVYVPDPHYVHVRYLKMCLLSKRARRDERENEYRNEFLNSI